MYKFVLGLVIGFLAYGLLELAAVAIVSRYFPHYIGRLQRLGDSLYRTFRKDPYETDDEDEADEEEGEEEYGCDCPACTCDQEYAPGQAVAFQDHGSDGYGALRGTVLSPATDIYYDIDDGENTRCIMADRIAPLPDGGIIPEGTPVTFFPNRGPAVTEGVTYRARVYDKTLWYLIEYGVDGDVKQDCVAAKSVQLKAVAKPAEPKGE